MAELVEKIEQTARDVGVMQEKLEVKFKNLGLMPEQAVMTLTEASTKSEAELPRELLVRVVDYWSTHDQLVLKQELLDALKAEAKSSRSRAQHGGGGGGGTWSRKLDGKVVAHLKDSKFSGKDGGAGWTNFFEDLMVVLGSVDKDLETSAK